MARSMTTKTSPDVPKVTSDEATELMVHHLGLAAAYFQCVPDDMNKAVNAEIWRQLKDDSFAFAPAQAFAEKILKLYEDDKDDE